VVIPGSHKSHFKRPEDFYVPATDSLNPEPHPAVLNITPKAGNAVIISELLTHGWRPTRCLRRGSVSLATLSSSTDRFRASARTSSSNPRRRTQPARNQVQRP